MLTSRHPSAQDCWTNDDILASDRPTWLHSLGAAGYRPTLIGRMHAMGPDQLHGYSDREIGDHSPNWGGAARHDMGVLNKTNDPNSESVTLSGAGQSMYELKDRDVARAAVARLDRIGAERREGRNTPFAITVGFMLPHAPYVASRSDFDRFAGRTPPPRCEPPAPDAEHPWIGWWRTSRGVTKIDRADAIRARTSYYALTYRLDVMIGEVLAALDRNGLRDNTLIVYASDHGDQIGERGLWWKHTFYEECVRVPLLMSWPGVLPAGERRPHVVNLVDLSATMLEAMGAPPLPHAQGRSFLKVAQSANAPWIDETVSEYCTDSVPDWTGGMAVRQRMCRQGRWKLIYYHGYRPQLFDLADDPGEQHDLATDPAFGSVCDSLLARVLADWSPCDIDRRMRARRRDKDLIAAWARATNPASIYRWPTSPEQNRLDG